MSPVSSPLPHPLVCFRLPPIRVANLRTFRNTLTGENGGKNQETRQQLLERAISRHDAGVLSLLARNPQTSARDLARIYAACKRTFNTSSSRDYEVFYSLAQNPRTPAKILAILATAEESSTRVEVATNPGTPSESLYRLAGDRDDLVRTWVTHNPNIPVELLQQLSQDRDEVTRNHAAGSLADRQANKEIVR